MNPRGLTIRCRRDRPDGQRPELKHRLSEMTISLRFKEHANSVEKLMSFDRDVLDFAILSLEEMRDRLVNHHQLGNPHLTAENTLQLLRGIRKNDSLRPRYQTIFNQALVLLVSYFGSSINDLFRLGVSEALDRGTDSGLLKEQVKVSFRELRDANFQLRDMAADLLIQTKDISFQDMQSVSRAFKEYVGISIEKTASVNEIILGQACRHAIVHSGGVADDRLLRQISGAHPRTIKPKIKLGENIQFSVEEVSQVANEMMAYLQGIEGQLSRLSGGVA